MNAHGILSVIGWVIVASLVVLVFMNASSFATVMGSASNALLSQSVVLTGAGYSGGYSGLFKKAA